MNSKLGAIVACILAASCMRPGIIWLDGASTSQRVVFGVAKHRGEDKPVADLRTFSLKSCYVAADVPQGVYWQATGRILEGPPPLRVTYGVAPNGFQNATPPALLVPGCYDASISGEGVSSTVRFELRSDGSVVEKKRPLGS